MGDGAYDEEENHGGNNEKVDDCINERAVIDGYSPGCLGGCQRSIWAGYCPLLQDYEKVDKIYFTQCQPYRRHDDVLYQGADNRAERGTDDYTYRYVDDVSPRYERPEVFKHTFLLYSKSCFIIQKKLIFHKGEKLLGRIIISYRNVLVNLLTNQFGESAFCQTAE